MVISLGPFCANRRTNLRIPDFKQNFVTTQVENCPWFVTRLCSKLGMRRFVRRYKHKHETVLRKLLFMGFPIKKFL